MATIKEEFELLKAKILAGKSQEQIHIVYHEAERKRKKDNPQGSTRVILNCYSPEAYSAFQMEKDRYFSVVVDVRIAIDFMVKALKQVDDATLRLWLEGGHNHDAGPAPEKAEIPDWLK